MFMSACGSSSGANKELEADNKRLVAEAEELKKALAEKEVQETLKEEADKVTQSVDEQNTPPTEAQKTYYIDSTKPGIDYVLDEYDLIWESLWTKTFTGLSDGSTSFVDGYAKLKTAQKRYDRLYEKIGEIPTGNLGKEQQKKVGSFSLEMEDSVGLRLEAITKAKKMLDKEDLSASTINEIQEIVEGADNFLLQARSYISEVEKEFGITR